MSSTPQNAGPDSSAEPNGQPADGPRPQAPERPHASPPALHPPAPAPQAMTIDAPALSDEMNAQIDAAMRSMDAQDTVNAAAAGKQPQDAGARPTIRGPRVVQAGREMRPGKVVSVGPTDVFIEFGPKELGVIPRTQWPEDKDLPERDATIEVVVSGRDSDGLLLCSRPGSVQKADWEFLEPGQTIEARVTGVNKGGLDLEVAGHRAFMPAGQVGLDHIADLAVFVGEKMTCKVTRVDRAGRGNIVLSRREVLAEQRKEQAEKLKSSLHEGQVIEGVVRKIMAFGAFVDMGGIDGLIHVSDLTHERVGHGEKFVQKYVKEGDKVRVQILKLDWEGKRISLGMKQTQDDPFATAANQISEGAEVTGRVTKLMEFGAFIEVAPGVEGLVHISELAWRRVGKAEDVVKQDEIVKAKVLKVDPDSRRISLSIKALTQPPEPTGAQKAKREKDQRAIEQIQKVTPELRRLREKFGGKQLKGGI